MRFLFPGMKAFRLFCLCLSKVILVGLLYGICGLEGGTNMLLYNFKKAFVYFDFGDTPAIYKNNIHSFTYHETGKQGNGSWDVEMNLLQESYLIVLPVSSLPTYLFV